MEWEVENVIDWLHFIQLEHLESVFRERSVTGAKLNAITQKELQFMGVIKPDEQQTILHEVSHCFCQLIMFIVYTRILTARVNTHLIQVVFSKNHAKMSPKLAKQELIAYATIRVDAVVVYVYFMKVAELRMLWQMESETGSQLMFDDITAGLANMSVRRKDLEKELDSHVTEVQSIIDCIDLHSDNETNFKSHSPCIPR